MWYNSLQSPTSMARYRGVVLNGWRRLDQDGMTIYTSKNK